MSNSLWPHGCNMPDFPLLHYLLEFAQTHIHWVSDAIQPSHPLSPLSPPAFNLSQHQGLFHESALRIRWPKYWSFSFSISPSNEYSELISFSTELVCSSCCPRDYQKSSPAPQFKNINSSALCLFYNHHGFFSPDLPSWKPPKYLYVLYLII